jgi:hypothetical protein
MNDDDEVRYVEIRGEVFECYTVPNHLSVTTREAVLDVAPARTSRLPYCRYQRLSRRIRTAISANKTPGM